ncbi:MAG TPA: ABC transporter permease [Hyphomicrobiaceae bacterium]
MLLVIWEAASRLGFVNQHILPAPSAIAATLFELIWSLELLHHLAASMYRIFTGFAIAVVSSVVLGLLMARFHLIEMVFDPLVELLRPVSPLAIFPVAILWFGIGDASKIFLVALACSFPIILNTYAGVRAIDVNYIRAARSLGANGWEIIYKVIWVSCLPHVFTGLRISWGISLIVIVAAEMIGSDSGIGYLILDAQQTFRIERVYAGVFVIGVVGFATDQIFRYLRRALLPWHREMRE